MKTKLLLLHINLMYLREQLVKKEISNLEYYIQKEKLIREIEGLK